MISREPWEKFIAELKDAEAKKLMASFGSLKKPAPDEFGIAWNETKAAKIAFGRNQESFAARQNEINRRRDLRRKNLASWFLSNLRPLPAVVIDPLGANYQEYLDRLAVYNEIVEYLEREKRREMLKKKTDYWFSLGGFEFEEEVAKLLRRKYIGSSVVKTKSTGDGGIDLIIEGEHPKTFVQCKAHKTPVGPHAVRDLYGAMRAAGVDDGILISLGGVSRAAMTFAEDNNIIVLDVHDIIEIHNSISGAG